MNTDRNLDRESFQTFLANAYAVQESGIDGQSLSAFVTLQKSIAKGESGLDETMGFVVDRASQVALADGVAIALLEGNQLVYRAGSGSAVSRLGHHVTAVLSASAGNGRREILRVENANSDSRIEADICRRFGATSLLILPIYREHSVAGVMEVVFGEQHAFRDREVRTYRLLAGLVEEAMTRDAQRAEEKPALELPVVVRPVVKPLIAEAPAVVTQAQHTAVRERLVRVALEPWVRRACAAAAGIAPAVVPQLKQAALVAGQLKEKVRTHMQQSVAAVSVVGALVIATWAAYAHRTELSAIRPAMVNSNVGQQVPFVTKPSANRSSDARTSFAMRGTGSLAGFRRKQVGPNEVDYVTDDVTVRIFSPTRGAPHSPRWTRQVVIGDDVTVRYFASRPATAIPVSTAGQAAEHSRSVSK